MLGGAGLQTLGNGVAATGDVPADAVRGTVLLAITVGEGAPGPDLRVDVAEIEFRVERQGAAAAWPTT